MTKSKTSAKDGDTDAKDGSETPRGSLVAIGSSAGGLVALTALFDNLPTDLGVSFVIITHLDPTHPSELASILSRHTQMPVTEVTEARMIERDHVYIVAPNRQLAVKDNELATLPFDQPRGQRAPIDLFFRSLSERHRDGFAIVLSGGGSDGSIGIRAMKEAGGVILAQDPDEAEYPSMPRSAISTGCVDVVLPVRQLAGKLVELTRDGKRLDADLPVGETKEIVRRIMALLRLRTGHDFSSYKSPTIMRRLTRRMQLRRIDRVEEYYDLLGDDPDEVQALFDDMLISVTTFFRDPDSFEALRSQVIADLLSADTCPLRIWVPGCATGEEVYSLVILLLEETARAETQREFQVFATDIDASALTTAREGLYPAAIANDVSKERLQRFFTLEGDRYRIKQGLRDIVVFANHSVLKDPPFSRLDLVSCRNLLIYLDQQAQNTVLATLHYALKPGGFLFFGSVESADGMPDNFRVVDRKNRIYQAIRQAQRVPVPSQIPTPQPAAPLVRPFPVTVSGAIEAAAHRRALEEAAPPSILVDAEGRILHLSETAGRFLQHPAGTLTSDIVQLVRPELKLELSRGLHVALEKSEAIVSPPVAVQFNGTPTRVMLQVRPAKRAEDVSEALVLFIEAGPIEAPDSPALRQDVGADDDSMVRRLQEELEFAREQLRGSRAEYAAANEALRASNEELQSINEEYRSTSEELETSKEELQSMNEELQTLNAELKEKVESLSLSNANLQNLIAAMEGGTIFLDDELQIKFFTPGIVNQFNVTQSDVGRPITDFTHRLSYDALTEDLRRVLRDLTPISHKVEGAGQEWFLIRIRPYRTLEDRIDGVVVSVIDITQLHHTEIALKDSESRFRALVSATSYAVYRMSPDWTEMRELDGGGFLKETPSPRTNWLAENIDPEDQPEMMEAAAEAIRTKSPFQLEHRMKRPDGTLCWTFSRAVPILDANREIVEWFGAASDITERHLAQEELANARRIEAIGRLAGGIAHDFNNLLTVITANLELLALRIEDETLRRLIDRATEAAFLGASFNRRLLSLAGKRPYRPEVSSLNDRVQEMAALLQHALGDQFVVSTSLAEDLWLVNIDAGEIDSALLNLALNSRDAMPKGGEITFTTRNETLDAGSGDGKMSVTPGEYACLEVRDNGPGMTADVLKHATEAFYSTKKDGMRTGLGLFSVLAFVEHSGGGVDIDSRRGAGTSVTLCLPRAPSAASNEPAPEPSADSVPAGDGELILVVEDNPAVREVAREQLESLGYRVNETPTAAEAVEMLKSDDAIRLVFSDIVMPGSMSGLDLAGWVVAQKPEIGVLLCSGYDPEAPPPDHTVRRGQGVLAKPYSLADLAQAVRAALETE